MVVSRYMYALFRLVYALLRSFTLRSFSGVLMIESWMKSDVS
jgi:hypothetical protein